MNITDTLEIAHWLWPDAEVEQARWWDSHLMDVAQVSWDEWDVHPTKRRPSFTFNASLNLNDCALAYPVLEARGLMGEYVLALSKITHCLPQEKWWDIVDVCCLAKADASQMATALLQVAQNNPLPEKTDE